VTSSEADPTRMALKAIIYKASLQIANMDRNVYADHAVTIARHPSETDERMLIRLLAFALNVPATDDQGALEFAKDLWEAEEPGLWEKDLTGQIRHWIEIGQPDEKRLIRAGSRVGRVSVYSFSASTPIWWNGISGKIQPAGPGQVSANFALKLQWGSYIPVALMQLVAVIVVVMINYYAAAFWFLLLIAGLGVSAWAASSSLPDKALAEIIRNLQGGAVAGPQIIAPTVVRPASAAAP